MAAGMPRYDVVIVGARVAGASAALHLARAGFDVLVLERAEALGPALSSHQMNIVGSECLRAWGLYDEVLSSDCPGMREILFDIGDVSVVSNVPPIGDLAQLHYCKRKVLDNILIAYAERAGARVEYGLRFRVIVGMDEEGVTIEAERPGSSPCRLRARFLVGADGRVSSVARALGAAEYDVMSERAISCFGYYSGHVTERLEIFMRNTYSVAVFPTNEGETCAVLAQQLPQKRSDLPDKAALLDAVIGSTPSLHEKLASCAAEPPRIYRFRGATGFLRQPYVGRCALVGDAGYFRDPIVGDGIADAMLSAELLAGQLAKMLRGAKPAPAFEVYKRVRDAYFRPAYERTRKMLRFDYDFAKLNHQVQGTASGPMVLRRVFDMLLTENRRTRRDLFRLLAETEKGFRGW